ncbi:MAG TPA: DUF2269 family protein [Candidatus Limnocylindrales bacterium]|nr:DUF2269 family protein [Candidatus Limnocylindrales bacterium]
MSPLLALFLFLHVMGAIAVFGPTFVFPIIANQVRKMPQHAHFAAVLGEFIETRVVLPGAVVQGITGLILIGILGVNPFTDAPWRWLLIGIVLYLIAIGFAATVQRRNAEKMVELTSHMPPGPPPAGAPAGPPPEIAATGAALARGGQLLTVLIVLIVILMVTKPTIG